MRPVSSSTVIRSDLGALLYKFFNDPSVFVMSQVLPTFKTPVASGQYPIIPKEHFIKGPSNIARAARSDYYRDDAFFDVDNFATEERGVEILLDDSERNLYSHLFDAEKPIVERLSNIMLRQHEMKGAALLTNTSTFTNASASTAWSTAATCDPRADVAARKVAIRNVTGITPDTVVMSIKAFEAIVASKAFNSACQYFAAPLLSTEETQKKLVAQYLGVDKLMVVGGIKDTNKKPNANTIASIWNDAIVMVCKTADNPNDLKEPCVGRTFLFTGDSPDIITLESYREENKRSTVYRARSYLAEKIVCAELGQLITGAIS